LYTFIDAVDRLLGLDNRAGLAYNLYLMDRDKKYATRAEHKAFLAEPHRSGLSIWANGPGDYSHDRLAWEWMLDQLGAWGPDGADVGRSSSSPGPANPSPGRGSPGGRTAS
jgi:hypothetical protein